MTVTTCPRPEEIQSLLEGGRPEGELAALEEHVQQCASCLARLDQLFCVPDTLVGLLSQAGTESPTTGPVVADMVQKIKSLRAASASGLRPRSCQPNIPRLPRSADPEAPEISRRLTPCRTAA